MQKSFSPIRLKKKYSQNFLKDTRYLDAILNAVELDKETSVFEIGGGAGALTKAILRRSIRQLWVFEIDSEWAAELRKIKDDRLTVFEENFLDGDFSRFETFKPWTLLANLPYQITFPILHILQKHRAILKEGVIMVQEEVAQKILKTGGRNYGFISLFFQWFFDWKMLDKVPPEAFYPKPKVFSRLLYFKPKKDIPSIEQEAEFWQFIKTCFKQPRRTLRNNLAQSHYNISAIDPKTLELRAQQLSMVDLLALWRQLIA
ncbi:TPA: ribosomal RNA small subunit methyltransferase A [Candidatus Dependentiae bacterium]|nr:MAG: Ribosomal RNA small subunit methyltransferase A [candidate division TM6 bacterium GW2011_GWF2_36_131]KKQ03490.1 MAG: Ribosomal RNA small subunit methyltransferase A [candidate division TM6 bacterium GW2011_GWE2_36_25]KKQ20236.1 MAG: Ribosomal RNA small subunit methyltransferase A [candidate division TM6 bacterium GW2011_GWA2_36_9]HBR70775.1 ribosomal RNA small subunit methyltransferase A [Candidatus Dependentiae bacterium]HCU00160.1 ribosomal RNA small subunit methyltransferase A [Candi